MKRIFFGLATFFIFSLFLTPSIIYAALFNVSPSSGTTSNSFSVTGTGYKPSYRHMVRAYLGNNVVNGWEVWTDASGNFTTTIGPFNSAGNYSIHLYEGLTDNLATQTITVTGGPVTLSCGSVCPPNGTNCASSCPCSIDGSVWRCGGPIIVPPPNPNSTWTNPCKDAQGNPSTTELPTAIGCIGYTSTTGLTKSLLQFALGIGGGIAFLLMIFGSFMIMTSSGNPERQQAGKEMITSAIMGLLLILLSVFILQLIGVKILAIPGFL